MTKEELQQYRQLLERKLEEAESASPNAAPFGMDADAANGWNSGRAAAYQFALEMLPTE